jgi:hypothetical protein
MAVDITVHVERRAVCERCGSVFDSQAIPAHQVPGQRRCLGTPKGARRAVVVFRLDSGEELTTVEDGGRLPDFTEPEEL